jgi:hypothetical protein
MKMVRQHKLTKELKVLFTFGVIIILLYLALPDHYYYGALHVQAQLQQQEQRLPPIISVKITSPVVNQVPVGELTISGISTDNATSDCTVYADWNNTKPFQKAVATGPGGVEDYSTWTFTYTDKYHLITNGTNNLTSKLSCINDGNIGGIAATNITKSYSINVIGIMEPSQRPASSSATAVEEQQNNVSSGSVSTSSSLPSLKEDNTNNNTKTGPTITTSNPESIPSVPITPEPAPGDNNENTTVYWDIQ